eukprot:SAG11_NODE_2502_length_3279_cov_1.547627_3_plen_156_part_00
MRVLHYPPLPEAQHTTEGCGGSIRAGAHTDINTITLLLGAEEQGLQVLTREGEWVNINPPAGALVVNMGDMLMRATNGVLRSTPVGLLGFRWQRSICLDNCQLINCQLSPKCPPWLTRAQWSCALRSTVLLIRAPRACGSHAFPYHFSFTTTLTF